MFEAHLEDFYSIRNLGVIAMSKQLYLKCEEDIKKIIVLLSIISLKDEGKENLTKEEIVNRVIFINKYFDIKNPEIINNTFYFKPNMRRVHHLILSNKFQLLSV